jgi:hypothetical protein
MSKPRCRSFVRRLLAPAIAAEVASLVTLYLRPHPPEVPSPWYSGPTEAERALERRVAEVDLRGLTFEEGMIRLEKAWNLAIDVDWAALEQRGWSRNSPLTFRARDVSLEEALRYTLTASKDKPPLGFAPRSGRILIGARPVPESSAVIVRATT